METHIEISRNGTSLGIYSLEEIHLLLGDGTLRLDDLSKSDEELEWKPLRDIPGMDRSARLYRPPPAARSEDHPLSTSILKRKRSSRRKSYQYAGLMIRTLAFGIDLMILSLFLIIIDVSLIVPSHDPAHFFRQPNGDVMIPWYFWVVLIVFFSLYHAVFEVARSQGTPGKLLLGLRVIDSKGSRPSLFQSLIRFFTKCVSILFLGVGCLMILDNSRCQALHDRIVGTRVIFD